MRNRGFLGGVRPQCSYSGKEYGAFWHGFSIDVCNQREIQKTVYEITGEKRFKVIIL